MNTIIACDFDGTLVYYDQWRGAKHIGRPIPAMLGRVKQWIKQGKTVVIFTARAADPEAVQAIKDWFPTVGLPELEITNIKSPLFVEMWDDRAITVAQNTGRILTITKIGKRIGEEHE